MKHTVKEKEIKLKRKKGNRNEKTRQPNVSNWYLWVLIAWGMKRWEWYYSLLQHTAVQYSTLYSTVHCTEQYTVQNGTAHSSTYSILYFTYSTTCKSHVLEHLPTLSLSAPTVHITNMYINSIRLLYWHCTRGLPPTAGGGKDNSQC